MRGMNSASVDLIYLDPPFNSNRNYSAPIGSEAAGAAFKDTWTLSDVDIAWHGEIAENAPAVYSIIHAAGLAHGAGMKSYLIMMAVRLLEMHRLLKDTGSLYLHCDPTASHYLKMLMDAVFGKENFRNEIVWYYGGRGAKAISKQFARNKDAILFYSRKNGKHLFTKQYLKRTFSDTEARKKGFRKDEKGRWYKTSPRGDYTDESIERLRKEDRVYITANDKIRIKYFLETDRGNVIEKMLAGDTWTDIPDAMHMSRKERVGYPTQKPLALLQRIINASSNPGDIVFDPFCGCATTLVAAEASERQWVGIDLSPLAAKLVEQRLHRRLGAWGTVIHRDDIPKRTDMGDLPHYRTHKQTLFGRQEGHCAGCETVFPFRNFTVDHIVPRSKGGHDHIDNLQLLCNACNSQKGNRSQEELLVRLQAAGLRSVPD